MTPLLKAPIPRQNGRSVVREFVHCDIPQTPALHSPRDGGRSVPVEHGGLREKTLCRYSLLFPRKSYEAREPGQTPDPYGSRMNVWHRRCQEGDSSPQASHDGPLSIALLPRMPTLCVTKQAGEANMEEEQQPRMNQNERPYRQEDSPNRLLIVDDDHGIVDLLAMQLKSEGYEIERALGGQEALDRIARDAPDLILLDIAMPGISVSTS